jgi:transposase
MSRMSDPLMPAFTIARQEMISRECSSMMNAPRTTSPFQQGNSKPLEPVGQRKQLINALRAHLSEHGIVVPKGLGNLERLAVITRTHEAELPELMREMTEVYLHQIARVSDEIGALETRISEEAKKSANVRRLRGMPGIGPICAMAIEAFAPPMEGFRRGRDFAAWLGLVPRQHSSGGKQKLGRISKMGQRDNRRLLIIGAISVVRWRSRNGSKPGSWLARMLARKPKLLVAIALANEMARAVWAILTRNEDYQVPKGAVC